MQPNPGYRQLAEAQAGEAKTKKAPKRKAKKNKSGLKKSVVAGPEEEAALALPSGISAGAVAEGPRVESSGSSDQALGTEGATYQPRVFSKARLAYIAEKRPVACGWPPMREPPTWRR